MFPPVLPVLQSSLGPMLLLSGDRFAPLGLEKIGKGLDLLSSRENVVEQAEFNSFMWAHNSVSQFVPALLLHHKNSLKELTLSNCAMKFAGALSFAKMLKAFFLSRPQGGVLSFVLKNDMLHVDGSCRIIEALNSCNCDCHLDLSGNTIQESNEMLARAIGKSQTITRLNLSFNSISVNSFGLMLELNSKITHLGLIQSIISDEGHDGERFSGSLARNKTLTFLNLARNHFSDEFCASFSEGLLENTAITHLNLSECRNTSQIISSCGKLVSLDVSQISFNSSELSALVEVLQSSLCLSKVSMVYCQLSDEKFSRISDAIIRNNRLMHLNISQNKITSKSLRFNKCLTYLDISFNPMENLDFVCKALESDQFSLKCLKIQNMSKLGDDSFTAFSKVLRYNTSLQVLHMFNNPQFSPSAECFAKNVIRFNNHLRELLMHGCDPSWPKGALKIAENLQHNHCLRKLHIADIKEEQVVDAGLTFSSFASLNGSLESCDLVACADTCARNKNNRIHAAQDAILVLSIRKFRLESALTVLPKDVVKLVAFQIWRFRTNFFE